MHDLGDVALVPGLVNAHTHLEFSDLAKPLGRPGMGLADWIRLVIAERQRGDRSPRAAIAGGIEESVAAGVTAIGEIATVEPDAYAPCPAVDLTLLAEAIGFSPARAESVLGAVSERLDGWLGWSEATPQCTGGSLRSTPATHGASVHLGVSPHAPYSVSPQLLDALVALARRRGLPVAMHLAESEEELELLATGGGPLQELLDERSMWDAAAIPRDTKPADYLWRLTGAPRALVIHGNYLGGEDRALLAAHADRMSVVYCPRTHAYFGHLPYPLARMLSAGVRVVLGTDSRASNPDLSLLDEMRYVAREHPHVEPPTILRMATQWAAEALGRGEELGSITVGKRADLVALPLPAGAGGSPDELLAAILAAGDAPQPVVRRT